MNLNLKGKQNCYETLKELNNLKLNQRQSIIDFDFIRFVNSSRLLKLTKVDLHQVDVKYGLPKLFSELEYKQIDFTCLIISLLEIISSTSTKEFRVSEVIF